MDLLDGAGRLLNHVELVHSPGERLLAIQFLELLGCRVEDNGGMWVVAKIDSDGGDLRNNVIYVSEVTREQWQFEQSLDRASYEGTDLGQTKSAYQALLSKRPQLSTHFGIRYPTMTAWEETLYRIETQGGGALSGRVQLSGLFKPNGPPDDTDGLVQAFVKTDLMAAGLLTLGQHIELQSVVGW